MDSGEFPHTVHAPQELCGPMQSTEIPRTTAFQGQQHKQVGVKVNSTGQKWPACGSLYHCGHYAENVMHEGLGQLWEGFLILIKIGGF